MNFSVYLYWPVPVKVIKPVVTPIHESKDNNYIDGVLGVICDSLLIFGGADQSLKLPRIYNRPGEVRKVDYTVGCTSTA